MMMVDSSERMSKASLSLRSVTLAHNQTTLAPVPMTQTEQMARLSPRCQLSTLHLLQLGPDYSINIMTIPMLPQVSMIMAQISERTLKASPSLRSANRQSSSQWALVHTTLTELTGRPSPRCPTSTWDLRQAVPAPTPTIQKMAIWLRVLTMITAINLAIMLKASQSVKSAKRH